MKSEGMRHAFDVHNGCPCRLETLVEQFAEWVSISHKDIGAVPTYP